MALKHLFYGGNGTIAVDSGLPRVGVIHGVAQNGDLLWYRYNRHGERERSGSKGWHPQRRRHRWEAPTARPGSICH